MRGGLARVAVWSYLFKAYALKDWAAFLEVFGMPLRIGRYGPGASDEDKRILRQAVINLGSDAAAVLHESMQIEFQDAVQGRGGEGLFLAAAEFWDKQTSKAVLGQTASTEGTPGKLGNDAAQMEVRQDILRADAAVLAATLNRDLVKPFIDLNFGQPPDNRYPRIVLPLPEPDKMEAIVDAIARLVPLGLRVDQHTLCELLGLPEPGSDAQLLGTPASATQASNQALGHILTALAQATPAQAQSELDALTEETTQNWQPLLAPLLDPLVQALGQAKSPTDLARLLAQALPESDPAPLAKAIARATFKARGMGDGEG